MKPLTRSSTEIAELLASDNAEAQAMTDSAKEKLADELEVARNRKGETCAARRATSPLEPRRDPGLFKPSPR